MLTKLIVSGNNDTRRLQEETTSDPVIVLARDVFSKMGEINFVKHGGSDTGCCC